MRSSCKTPEQGGQVQEDGDQQQDVGEKLKHKSTPWGQRFSEATSRSTWLPHSETDVSAHATCGNPAPYRITASNG